MASPVQFNVATQAPEGGFPQFLDGWFVFEVQDARQLRMENNQEHQRRNYRMKCIGAALQEQQKFIGKPFFHGLRESAEWHGRHMELFCACFGSRQAVVNAASSAGGVFDVEWLHGKRFLGYVTARDRFSNITKCAAYTQENWNSIIQGNDIPSIAESDGQFAPPPAQQQAAAAPQPVAAPPAAPAGYLPQPMAAAPAYAVQTAPVGAPPMVQGAPQFAPPPPVAAPGAPVAVPPGPPPPPGMIRQ